MLPSISGPKGKLFRLGIRVCLFIFAGIVYWITEQRQSDFGKAFAKDLIKLHSNLTIEKIDFEKDNSYVIFDFPTDSLQIEMRDEFINKLSSDIRDVYCKQLKSTSNDLRIKLFHVSIRAVASEGSNMIYSEMLGDGDCK